MSRLFPPPSTVSRELDFGTVNVYPLPMPQGGPAPFTQVASALVLPLDPNHTVEHWVLFESYSAPKLLPNGPGTGIVIQAVPPSATAPALHQWTGNDMPTVQEFLAAMADLAAQRNQSFTVLLVNCTRQP